MEELPWVSEAFITSSTRGVLPIIQIDDVIIGNGNPGELTMSLHAAFEARVKEAIMASQTN